MREYDFYSPNVEAAAAHQRHNAVEPLPREEYNDLPIGRHGPCDDPDCWGCVAVRKAWAIRVAAEKLRRWDGRIPA